SGRELLFNCAARLERCDTRELATLNRDRQESKAGKSIQQCLRDLPRVSDAITATYFAHSTISRTGREGGP
ncbi:MAG TPA: hypothetical protein VLT36_04340, partial [Candidatus Dormibacteraeota bacterium]|nr:hypothetical protein [Candidatus Dormibacteraeota bacterium]